MKKVKLNKGKVDDPILCDGHILTKKWYLDILENKQITILLLVFILSQIYIRMIYSSLKLNGFSHSPNIVNFVDIITDTFVKKCCPSHMFVKKCCPSHMFVKNVYHHDLSEVDSTMIVAAAI